MDRRDGFADPGVGAAAGIGEDAGFLDLGAAAGLGEQLRGALFLVLAMAGLARWRADARRCSSVCRWSAVAASSSFASVRAV